MVRAVRSFRHKATLQPLADWDERLDPINFARLRRFTTSPILSNAKPLDGPCVQLQIPFEHNHAAVLRKVCTILRDLLPHDHNHRRV